MGREIILLKEMMYIVDNTAPKYRDWYVVGKFVWKHILPGWGSAGHGEAKTILACNDPRVRDVPRIKEEFLAKVKNKDKDIANLLRDDSNFMYIKTLETVDEAAERFYQELLASNPKGGAKEFIRLAVNFGAAWQKERSAQ
jgi:hypothetical protein